VEQLFIDAAFHRSGFSSKQLFIEAAFHRIPIGMAFHQTYLLISGSFIKLFQRVFDE
jgi:hypothetical protein